MHSKNTPIVFIQCLRGVLRPIREEEIPLYTKWINDPEVRQYLTTRFPLTEIQEREWVTGRKEKSNDTITLTYAVSGKAIGNFSLANIDWVSKTALTGGMMGEKKFWGKGYGTDAKMGLLNYGFNELGLRKVVSRVFAFNERSLAYLKKQGYQEIGRLKRQKLHDGAYVDEVILELFAEDFTPIYAAYCAKYTKKK